MICDITNCYNESDAPVWTTRDWLSGERFIIDSFDNCVGVDGIKEQTTLVNGTEASLSAVCRQLLPWNLNIKSILIFQQQRPTSSRQYDGRFRVSTRDVHRYLFRAHRQ